MKFSTGIIGFFLGVCATIATARDGRREFSRYLGKNPVRIWINGQGAEYSYPASMPYDGIEATRFQVWLKPHNESWRRVFRADGVNRGQYTSLNGYAQIEWKGNVILDSQIPDWRLSSLSLTPGTAPREEALQKSPNTLLEKKWGAYVYGIPVAYTMNVKGRTNTSYLCGASEIGGGLSSDVFYELTGGDRGTVTVPYNKNWVFVIDIEQNYELMYDHFEGRVKSAFKSGQSRVGTGSYVANKVYPQSTVLRAVCFWIHRKTGQPYFAGNPQYNVIGEAIREFYESW